MDKSNTALGAEDAAAIFELIGETAVIEEGLAAQRRYLMSGVARLIRADSWAWATTSRFDGDEAPANAGFLWEGFTAEEYARFHEALAHPDTAIINARFMRELSEKQTHLTRHLGQMDPEGFFPRSAVHAIWREAGVAQVIMSARPAAGYLSHAGFYRRSGGEPFSARETKIAHIVLSEVPWLHEVLPADLGVVVNALSPRKRVVMNLLVEGLSRREIADHLGLSTHTVDGYAKEVFHHFHVHSQPELITRFRLGDGGDLP